MRAFRKAETQPSQAEHSSYLYEEQSLSSTSLLQQSYTLCEVRVKIDASTAATLRVRTDSDAGELAREFCREHGLGANQERAIEVLVQRILDDDTLSVNPP